ncbi:hypothetical protein NFI96_028175 [Prochilodus magdalenae]|nr:hypothetical protein NFI96_028175 [Prochilodus magdalenae]
MCFRFSSGWARPLGAQERDRISWPKSAPSTTGFTTVQLCNMEIQQVKQSSGHLVLLVIPHQEHTRPAPSASGSARSRAHGLVGQVRAPIGHGGALRLSAPRVH